MYFLALNGMSDGVTVLFTFVLGLLVIFFGMTVIILFLIIMGKIFDKINGKETKKFDSKPKEEPVKQKADEVRQEDIDENIKVAIISAIYALLQQENKSECEFIVRKIIRR